MDVLHRCGSYDVACKKILIDQCAEHSGRGGVTEFACCVNICEAIDKCVYLGQFGSSNLLKRLLKCVRCPQRKQENESSSVIPFFYGSGATG